METLILPALLGFIAMLMPRKPTWSESNPNVRRDAAKRLKSKAMVSP